jgi:cell division protein FtsQ
MSDTAPAFDLRRPGGQIVEERAVPKRGSALKKIASLCLALVCAELLWLFVINPAIPFASISITPQNPGTLTQAAVLNAAGVTSHSSWLTFNTRKAESALAALPEVSAARVEKSFPDTLSITLALRTPAGVSIASVGGKDTAVLYDKQGVVYRVGTNFTIPETAPLISGLTFDNPAPGMKLPEDLLPILTDTAALASKAPELLGAVSEIRVGAGEKGAAYSLTLRLGNSDAKILVGQSLREETLRYVILLADVLKQKGLDVDTIDYRAGTAVYTLKNEGKAANGEQ